MKFFRVVLIVFFVTIFGCASSSDIEYSWLKMNASDAQVLKDDGECNKFVDKLITPDRIRKSEKTRYESIRGLDDFDSVGNRHHNRKNRILVKDWCMQNRGYEKKIIQN